MCFTYISSDGSKFKDVSSMGKKISKQSICIYYDEMYIQRKGIWVHKNAMQKGTEKLYRYIQQYANNAQGQKGSLSVITSGG